MGEMGEKQRIKWCCNAMQGHEIDLIVRIHGTAHTVYIT